MTSILMNKTIKRILYILVQPPFLQLIIIITILVVGYFISHMEKGEPMSSENYCKDYPGDMNECIEVNYPSSGQSDGYPDW